MTAGLSAANANSDLNARAAIFLWVQLHTGDPGAAGTANLSSVTARQSITWNAASAGAMTASNVPSWGAWTGTSPETITHISFWNASSAGTFEASRLLPNPVTATTGFTVTLAQWTESEAAVAA